MNISKRLEVWVWQRLRVVRLGLVRRVAPSRVQFDREPVPASEHDIVVFTSADGRYLQRFLRTFIGSIIDHVTAPRVHVHLFNPAAEDFALLDEVARQHPSLVIGWSHETFSSDALERRAPSSPKQPWQSLYICCARFLAAQEVQRRTGASLLMTDIDILVNGDIAARFGGAVGVSLLLRPDERYLSKRTLGGVVYAANTAEGRQFLATTCDYIGRFLAAGFYWFAFDQYALYRGVAALSDVQRRAHFSALTERDVSFDVSGTGLIIYPKGKLKDSPEFAQLVHSFGSGEGA